MTLPPLNRRRRCGPAKPVLSLSLSCLPGGVGGQGSVWHVQKAFYGTQKSCCSGQCALRLQHACLGCTTVSTQSTLRMVSPPIKASLVSWNNVLGVMILFVPWGWLMIAFKVLARTMTRIGAPDCRWPPAYTPPPQPRPWSLKKNLLLYTQKILRDLRFGLHH